jgi:hypothetical protein
MSGIKDTNYSHQTTTATKFNVILYLVKKYISLVYLNLSE